MAAYALVGLTKEQRQLGYYNYCVAFVLAIILNGLLTFAVARRSTKMLQSYKKVFAFHIFIDVSLSSIAALTMCQPIGTKYNDQSIFFHIVAGWIRYPPQPWTTILACIAIFFAIYNVTTAPVSFIYRYLIICHNYELTWMPFLVLCGIAGIGPLAYSLLILLSELNTRDLEPQVAHLFDGTDWVDDDGSIPAFGVMYTSKTSVNSYITPATVIISYTIIIYCTIRISAKMWTLRSMAQNVTGKNRKSQSQLQMVLYSQAIIPFVTTGFSTLAIQIGKIFGLSQPWWFYYLNLLNTWAPVVNPLVALLVIAPYRKFVLHPFNSKVETSSSHNGIIGKRNQQDTVTLPPQGHRIANNIIKVVDK